MKIKNPLEFITSIIIYTSIFVASLFVSIDPDLGWHLKYGEHFFQNGGILRENTFSALMPDYKWTNSSWATDLITYQTFHNFNFIGLSVLGAFIITLTFFFLGKAAKLSIFERSIIYPIILYLVEPVNQISMRGQLLSLLFISILFFVLSKYENNKKSILFLIPFFTAWGNLHGQYILGLAIFFIWIFVYIVKEIYLNYRKDIKKFAMENKFLLTSAIATPLAVLINPFGLGVYKEALGHFDDPLQKSVTEFLAPSDFSAVWWHLLFAAVALVIGVALLGIGKKNFDKSPFYFPSFILFILTFWVRRYAWPFYYSLIFLLQPIAKYFEPDNKKISGLASFVISLLLLLFIAEIKYPFSDLREMSWGSFCKISVGCSPGAAKAVIDNKLNNEKLLTIYDYGGWLIWNYPQIKPTIDGRMHLWRDENDYSAFEYYYRIEQNLQDVDEQGYNAVLTSKRKQIFNRLMELREEGKWRVVHIDKYSAVFVRNQSID